MRQNRELTLLDIWSLIVINKIFLFIIFIFFCGITIAVVQNNSKTYYEQYFVIKSINLEFIKNIDLNKIGKIEELDDLISSDIKRSYASIFYIKSKDKKYYVRVSADNKEQAEKYFNKLSKNVYNFFISMNKNNLLKKQKVMKEEADNLIKQLENLQVQTKSNSKGFKTKSNSKGFKILYPVTYVKVTLLSKQYNNLLNELTKLNKVITMTQEQYISATTPIYQDSGISKKRQLLIGFAISLILSVIAVLLKSLIGVLIRNYKNEQ